MEIPAKTIRYRGGVITFVIPENWVEEYEPSGGATFYDDVPRSGTLRLNVLGFSGAENGDHPFADNAEFDNFRDDLYLKKDSKRFKEDGVECILLNWAVGYILEDGSINIASWNHTIEAESFHFSQTQQELDIIKSILWNAEFGRQVGEDGEYHH